MNKAYLLVGGSGGVGFAVKEYISHNKVQKDKLIEISRNSEDALIKKSLAETTSKDFDFLSTDYSLNIIFCHRYRGDDPLEEFKTHIIDPLKLINNLELKYNLSNIIFMTSTCVDRPVYNQNTTYHATRGAIDALIRKLAIDKGKNKCRVNGIAINTIIKHTNKDYFNDNCEIPDLLNKTTPLRRMGTAHDAAKTIYAICNKEFTFMTGQIINIDGGLSLVNQEDINIV
tara:strand:- start:1013 stop:1699 length:687 start_codon:yes stop_codon:yes gene_type:complete